MHEHNRDREPRCKVCNHPDVDRIEMLLHSGTPVRAIARQFNVSRSSLSRHRNHMNHRIVAIEVQRRELESVPFPDASIVRRADILVMEAWKLYEEARRMENLAAEVACLREVRACLETQARIRTLYGQPESSPKPIEIHFYALPMENAGEDGDEEVVTIHHAGTSPLEQEHP